MAVSPYFDLFPKVNYTLGEDKIVTENVTDIFKRYGVLRQILSNASSYTLYEIEENDTPEILAEKFYGDAGAGWIIIYANKIVDAQFDWPLADEAFKKYIINKYGSIDEAQTTYHHYEKVVETTVDGETYKRIYNVGKERYTDNKLDVPFTYYTPYTENLIVTADTDRVTTDNVFFTVDLSNHASYDDTSLPEYYSYETHEVNGKTVYMNTYGVAVSNYDYEYDLNEQKRTIKVIKAYYYAQIMKEFKDLTMGPSAFMRKF